MPLFHTNRFPQMIGDSSLSAHLVFGNLICLSGVPIILILRFVLLIVVGRGETAHGAGKGMQVVYLLQV